MIGILFGTCIQRIRHTYWSNEMDAACRCEQIHAYALRDRVWADGRDFWVGENCFDGRAFLTCK